MMKKITFLMCAVLCTMLTMNSCSESDPNYHTLGITSRLTDGPIVGLYADQTGDTLMLRSTDPWMADTQCSWMLFTQTGTQKDEEKFDYVYGREKVFLRPVSIEPNTTDAVRRTAVLLKANGHTISLLYLQLNHLNVVEPAVVYTDASTYVGASFSKKVGAAAQTTTVSAVLYADATISSDQEWLAIEQTSLAKGDNTVTLTIGQNTTGAERKANVTLLSSTGAKTTVTIVQEK
ncbi:MAG: BACON domain-containing protein [Bacteroidaceae bacterium]|nr:BACON domain-containing protein [Bacteroidaceae bacterium]